ncbi:MAG: PEP-CTERM sorting domain-containing protein [Burkholderiales bacterium]|nr:PEP-CTERM sorting domain-containing protein [Burkholderiales bacterium]
MTQLTPGVAILLATLALAGCGGGSGGAAQGSAQFQPLGFVAGLGYSEATAVSADGAAVAGTAKDAQGLPLAFRWSQAGGAQSLGLLTGGTRSTATAISSDGSVIAGFGDISVAPLGGTTGLRWTAAAGMEPLPRLGSSSMCAANGLSGDGSVAVGTCLLSNNTAFRWTASGLVGLGQYGGGLGAASSATAVSRDGAVTAGAGNPRLAGAMAWVGTSPVFLGLLGAGDQYASATALSSDGTVIAGMSIDSASVSHVFLWTAAGGMQRVPNPPGAVSGSVPAGISDTGLVVGWAITAGGEVAVIGTSGGGLQSLAEWLAREKGLALPPGWVLTRANAISPDGRFIAGAGTNPQGATEAWLLRID